MLQKFFILFHIFLFCSDSICRAQQKNKSYLTKLSTSLARQLYYNFPVDSLDIMLVQENDSSSVSGVSYRALYTYHTVKVIRIKASKMAKLLLDDNTIFADAIKILKEELTTGLLDISVNKLNFAHAQFPDINGKGILASIKEQQLDTADIDYAGRYVNTGAAAITNTTHASIMATALAGAGNSSPFAKGAAPAALVTSTSFTLLLPEEDKYYQQNHISIQNHSYGTVPENYYGAEAAAYDKSLEVNSTLVHVFSAGNAGMATGAGPYSSMQGWGNLTGNFKTAKNVIVVGAIDSFYQVSPSISKGPAFDGRVKPELVAFGEDGSSGAAALTSGTVTLLQQAYKNEEKKLPSAALVKAVLLNSADRLGKKHLSHIWGYGSLNGYKAVKTILDQRFYEDSIRHGDLKKFSITVPPRATELKLTLAWTDVPAVANTLKALVNNIDAVLKNEITGESWLPWVLSKAPNIDSLTIDAVRKKDSINNVEQITITAPVGGTYTVEIYGQNIKSKTQAFAIAYEIDTAAYFQWTFPVAADPVISAENNILRWQTTISDKGILEYNANGTLWLPISDTVSLQQGYYKWLAPDTITTAQVRMRFNNGMSALSDTFVISKAVAVKVGFQCKDSFLLFWNALPVSQYQIYSLDKNYLMPVETTSDTAVIFKTDKQSFYYSVAPVIHGREGIKSHTINYTTFGADCYFRSFYTLSQNENEALFALLIGTSYNISGVTFQKLQNGNYTALQTIQSPEAISFLFSDTVFTQGVNIYRVEIRLQNGAVIYSNEVSIYHFTAASVIIYPNPAPQHSIITLITNKAGRIRINVFNEAGQLVQQRQLNGLVNKMTLSHLSKGLYLVQILEDDGTRSTQKLVVY